MPSLLICWLLFLSNATTTSGYVYSSVSIGHCCWGAQGASIDTDRLGADSSGATWLLLRALDALNSVINSVLALSPFLLCGDLDREEDLDVDLRLRMGAYCLK